MDFFSLKIIYYIYKLISLYPKSLLARKKVNHDFIHQLRHILKIPLEVYRSLSTTLSYDDDDDDEVY